LAFQNSDVNPLFFRVIQVVRAYFEERCCSGASCSRLRSRASTDAATSHPELARDLS